MTIQEAYSRYDADPRVSGYNDFQAFSEAIEPILEAADIGQQVLDAAAEMQTDPGTIMMVTTCARVIAGAASKMDSGLTTLQCGEYLITCEKMGEEEPIDAKPR